MGAREAGATVMRTLWGHEHESYPEAVIADIIDGIPFVAMGTAPVRAIHAAVTVEDNQSRVRRLLVTTPKSILGSMGPLAMVNWAIPSNTGIHAAKQDARVTRPVRVIGNVITLPTKVFGECAGSGKFVQCAREIPEYVRDQ